MPGPRELLCGSWFSGLGDQRTWPTKRMPWWREWRWGFCSGLEQGRGARRRGADPQRPSRALGAGSQSRALRVPGALRGGSLGRVESATRRRRHGTSFLPLDSRLRAPVKRHRRLRFHGSLTKSQGRLASLTGSQGLTFEEQCGEGVLPRRQLRCQQGPGRGGTLVSLIRTSAKAASTRQSS